MQMKKLWRIFIGLLVFYLGLEIVINKICSGHHLVYKVKNNKHKITIDETYKKIDHDRYDFVFKVNGITFHQYFYKDLDNRNYMVSQVDYLEDNNYKCIYPIYKDKKIKSNLICFDGEYYYPYQAIIGKSEVIDNFMSNRFKTYEESKKEDNITIYQNNLFKKHKIFLENYKGIYFIDKDKVSNVSLFNKDVYTKNISGFTNEYYFVANYEDEYATNQLIYISLNNKKQKVLKKITPISFDSIVEGVIDDDIYLLDKSNKEQYKINLKDEKIDLIGNEKKKLSILEDGKWVKKNYYQVEQGNYYFSPYEINSTYNGIKYDKVDHFKDQKYDLYYLYTKTDKGYHMYKVDGDKKIISLFDVDDTNQVYYQENGFYFKYNDTIYYYDDNVGLLKMVTYSELKYNENLSFYVTFGT